MRIRVALLVLLAASPAAGMVPVWYRYAEPHLSRFAGRLPVIPENGYKAWYDRTFRLEKVEEYRNNAIVRHWVYHWSPDGQLASCDLHEGARGRTQGWRYDATGRLASRIQFTGQGAWNRPWLVYNLNYDSSGRLQGEQELVDGKVQRTIQYSYHPGGEILSRGIYTITGFLLERTVYRTDDAGRIQEALLYQWGRLAKVTVYRYSSEGFVIEETDRKPAPDDPLEDPLLEPVKPLPKAGN